MEDSLEEKAVGDVRGWSTGDSFMWLNSSRMIIGKWWRERERARKGEREKEGVKWKRGWP